MIEKDTTSIGTGLQRYVNDEDVQSEWFSVPVFREAIKKIQGLETDSILDVGCGNGRLNIVHEKSFSKIVGIDKFRSPNQKYCVSNFEFMEADIFDIKDKFSVVLFMGSFYIHCCYGYLETLIQAKKIMEKNGKIIIVDDKKRNIDSVSKLQNGYYNLEDLCLKSDLKIDQKFVDKDTPFSLCVLGAI